MGPSVTFRLAGVYVRCPLATIIGLVVLLFGLGTEARLRNVADVAWFSLSVALSFATIGVHEIARTLAFGWMGCRTRRNELTIAGGSPWLDDRTNSPVHEVVAGLVGLTAAAVTAGAALLASLSSPEASMAHRWLHAWWLLAAATAIVQLLPALPMDAGRLLRALVWYVSGSPLRGARVATVYGQLLAVGMIAGGCLMLASGGRWPFWGFGAIVLGYQTIVASARATADFALQAAGNDISLGQLNIVAAQHIEGSSSLVAVAECLTQPGAQRWLLVNGDASQPAGIIQWSDLRATPRRHWGKRRAHDAAQPLELLPRIDARQSATTSLFQLESLGESRLVVVTLTTAHEPIMSVTVIDARSLRSALFERIRAETNATEPVTQEVRP
jgi:Zn-dependent protease